MIDYKPERERIYSPTYTLFVLSEEEHAIWLTRQLDTWFKHALETYDKEQNLYARNRMLRDLPPEELDKESVRRQIKNQAASEKTQERRLSKLSDIGEEILKEAARNDQFNVATLETAAEMMGKLKDISDNRMPSVEDLLKAAADAKASDGGEPKGEPKAGEEAEPSDGSGESQPAEESDPKESKPSSGDSEKSETVPNVTEDKSNGGGAGDKKKEGEEDEEEKPQVPSITDKESTMMDEEEKKEGEEQEAGGKSTPKFTLPSTILSGGPKPEPGET